MSRLNQVEELMSEHKGHTHFLVNNDDLLVGTNDSSELFVIYHNMRPQQLRNFLPHEYVVHLLASFSEFL